MTVSVGAGDRDRTDDIQLGKLGVLKPGQTVSCKTDAFRSQSDQRDTAGTQSSTRLSGRCSPVAAFGSFTNDLPLGDNRLGPRGIGLTSQQVQKCQRGTNRVSAGRLQKIADLLNTPVMFSIAAWASALRSRTHATPASHSFSPRARCCRRAPPGASRLRIWANSGHRHERPRSVIPSTTGEGQKTIFGIPSSS